MQSSSLKSSTKRLSRARMEGEGEWLVGRAGAGARDGGGGLWDAANQRPRFGWRMQEEASVRSSAVILVWRGAIGVAPC